MRQFINQVADMSIYWLPALIGGVVDYLNQVQKGDKRWSLLGFVLHLFSAVFFGWLAGLAVQGLGYNSPMVGAAGGVAGFLGIRMADLVAHRFMGVDRRRGS